MYKFRLSQAFTDPGQLKNVGPMIKAQWRVATESEAVSLQDPAPVEGFMIVDTGFSGIGIDADVAREMNLSPVGETTLRGFEKAVSQPTHRAVLLMMPHNVDSESLAIGGPIEAVCLPGIRSGYDACELRTEKGTHLRVIGVLGRRFLRFTRFTYDGLNGNWDMEIDLDAMGLATSIETVDSDSNLNNLPASKFVN
jgi:hypothetical protein